MMPPAPSIPRFVKVTLGVVLFLGAVWQDVGLSAYAQSAGATLAWAPKPSRLVAYVGPNKPLWKLSDILARHGNETDWIQTVAETPNFTAQYIRMAQNAGTKSVFYADDRAFFVVEAGQILFKIEGQEPFVASKGFLVQVPARVSFQLQTVGNEPSLRFELHPAEPPIFPISETPSTLPGVSYIRASFKGHGSYDAINRPFLDFEKDIVQSGKPVPADFLKDPYLAVEIFRGQPVATPPDSDWGHFRANYPGLWFVLEGKENFLIEGEAPFTAEAGDVVFAPIGRWHRVSSGGEGPSTRLAINARPGNLHWYQPGAAGGE
jgi:mannose-6-phosphate isomerase-like protein (cupin superfamily)